MQKLIRRLVIVPAHFSGEIMFDWFIDSKFVENFFGFLLTLMVIVLIVSLVLFPVACYYDAKKPTFTLKKEEWKCERSHQEVAHSGFMSGNVLIPITISTTVCDEYVRVK
jgi:uncharacterized membrane protein